MTERYTAEQFEAAAEAVSLEPNDELGGMLRQAADTERERLRLARVLAGVRAYLEAQEDAAQARADIRVREPSREASQAVYWHSAQSVACANALAELDRLEREP